MIRRDLFLSMFGIGAGQFILLVSMPLLARAYGSAEFGTYSVIYAVAGIVGTIAALRMDLALGGADDVDVAVFARACVVLPFLVVPLAIAILWVALKTPLSVNIPFSASDLPMIGAIGLFQGLIFIASGLCTRLGMFWLFATIKVVQPLVFALAALLAVHNLVISMAIGAAVSAGFGLTALRGITLRRGWRESAGALIRMWQYPVISTPMALLNVLALALPLLAIATAYGARSAGDYAQVQRLLGAPLILVATAGGQTFIKHAGDRLRAGSSVTPLFWRFVAAMTVLAAMTMAATATVGHPILRSLVGPGWRTDGTFLVLVLLPVLWRVIASPVSFILVLTNRIGTLGAWQMAYFLYTVITLEIGSRFLNLDDLLLVFGIGCFFMYGFYLQISARAARKLNK